MLYVMNTEIKELFALSHILAEEGDRFSCNRTGVQKMFLECVLHICELKEPSCTRSTLQRNCM
jgi:hypothetical protein